jgi:hypothetical protein
MTLQDFYAKLQRFIGINKPKECYALMNWKTISDLCIESAGVHCSGQLMYGYKDPVKQTNITTVDIFDVPTFFHKHVPKDVVYFFVGDYRPIRSRCMEYEAAWEKDK